MNIEILNSSKNEIEFSINNPTIAEILRVYLYKEGADFAAWRREHPSKPLIMRIESSGKSVKKVISDAISAIKKDGNKIVSLIKK